jgi:hypothetical protein
MHVRHSQTTAAQFDPEILEVFVQAIFLAYAGKKSGANIRSRVAQIYEALGQLESAFKLTEFWSFAVEKSREEPEFPQDADSMLLGILGHALSCGVVIGEMSKDPASVQTMREFVAKAEAELDAHA